MIHGYMVNHRKYLDELSRVDPITVDQFKKLTWLWSADDDNELDMAGRSQLLLCLLDAMERKKFFPAITRITLGPRGERYRCTIQYQRIYVEGENREFGEDPWPEPGAAHGIDATEAVLRAYLKAIDADRRLKA